MSLTTDQPATTRLASCRPGTPLLEVKGLAVRFPSDRGIVHAVHDVSLTVLESETLGIVGESGSGKSVSALAVMALVPAPGRVVGGRIRWRGDDIDEKGLSALRGSKITMIYQDPMASLNPLKPLGEQVAEVLRRHCGLNRRDARSRTVELFDLVGIPEPRRRYDQYAYEFSGGMAQRVVIAMALAPEPELIIADEPTTALDVTIQAQILELIASLQRELGLSVMLITHDLGVVAGVADRVAVMYGGRVIEEGRAGAIFARPRHPYTAGLMASTPQPFARTERLVPIPGSPPTSALDVPGCAFAPRCPRAAGACWNERPDLVHVADFEGTSHRAACWHEL